MEIRTVYNIGYRFYEPVSNHGYGPVHKTDENGVKWTSHKNIYIPFVMTLEIVEIDIIVDKSNKITVEYKCFDIKDTNINNPYLYIYEEKDITKYTEGEAFSIASEAALKKEIL